MKQVLGQLFLAWLFGVFAIVMSMLLADSISKMGIPYFELLGIAFCMLCSSAAGFLTIRITGIRWFWWKTILACPVICVVMLAIAWGGANNFFRSLVSALITWGLTWGPVLLGAFVARWSLTRKDLNTK